MSDSKNTSFPSVASWFGKPQVWGFFLSIIVMAIISLLYFYPDNFDGNSLMQSDMQQGEANGHEGVLYNDATGEKALWTNSLFSGMPTFQISPSYPSNSLFDWINSLYGLWLPSPSNLLFMMMFGFLIMLYCMGLRWYYALIGAVAWGFSSYFMIIIGAGHIWKFVALSYIPPTIGGLVLCYRRRYLLGGALAALFAMMQLNANHPQMTYYFAFVMFGMAVAYLVDAVKQKQLRQWCIATAVLAVAGVLGVGANLPSLYNTYEYAKETKRASSELTPEVTANTPAERPTGGLPKGEIVGWSYGGSEMFSLLVPNIKGGANVKPENGKPQFLALDRLPDSQDASYQSQQLLGYFSQYFNDSEGTNGPVYVGALICALFLLGCLIVKGPMKWCLLVLTVISALLALGRNFESLTDFMIYNFPMYSKFRAVESILVIAEFTMPLLAVLALVKYFSGKPEAARTKALYISFGVCALVCLVAAAMPSVFGSAITSQDRQMFAQMQQQNIPTYELEQTITDLRYGMVRSDALRSLLFILIGFVPMALYARGKAGRGTAIAVVGAVVLIDLYVVDKRYVSHDNFAVTDLYAQTYYDPFAPDAIDQAISADTAMSYRVMDIPGFGDAHRSYHHKMIGGYHAAKLNRYEDLINRRMQHVRGIGYLPELRVDSVAASYTGNDRAVVGQLLADYRVLDMLNARYIITGDNERPVIANPNALGNAWLVDEIAYVENADAEMASLSALDPAHQAVADRRFLAALGSDVVKPEAGDTIYLTSYTPNRLTYHVDTRSGGIGVFSEVYFPWGWKAEIDGQPAELGRVNYILRALRLPAGAHTVTMTFDPESIHTTGAVAYASVSVIYLLLLLAIFVSVFRQKPENNS